MAVDLPAAGPASDMYKASNAGPANEAEVGSDSRSASSPSGHKGDAPGKEDTDDEPVASETDSALLPSELQAHAYPRDEPMHNDMSEYREVLEPQLSTEDRALLNQAREARMSGEGCLPTWEHVASSGRQLLRDCAALLDELCGEPPPDSCSPRPKLARRVLVDGGTLARTLSALAHWLQTSIGIWDDAIGKRVPQLLDRPFATLNVVLWIALLEVLHNIAGWFTAVGCPAVTKFLHSITSPFLLRCYYSLVARTCSVDTHWPALHAAQRLGLSACHGIRNPALATPPIFHIVLLARVILLLQALYDLSLSVISMWCGGASEANVSAHAARGLF